MQFLYVEAMSWFIYLSVDTISWYQIKTHNPSACFCWWNVIEVYSLLNGQLEWSKPCFTYWLPSVLSPRSIKNLIIFSHFITHQLVSGVSRLLDLVNNNVTFYNCTVCLSSNNAWWFVLIRLYSHWRSKNKWP